MKPNDKKKLEEAAELSEAEKKEIFQTAKAEEKIKAVESIKADAEKKLKAFAREEARREAEEELILINRAKAEEIEEANRIKNNSEYNIFDIETTKEIYIKPAPIEKRAKKLSKGEEFTLADLMANIGLGVTVTTIEGEEVLIQVKNKDHANELYKLQKTGAKIN